VTLTEQPPAAASTCNTISQQTADFFSERKLAAQTTTVHCVTKGIIVSADAAFFPV